MIGLASDLRQRQRSDRYFGLVDNELGKEKSNITHN